MWIEVNTRASKQNEPTEHLAAANVPHGSSWVGSHYWGFDSSSTLIGCDNVILPSPMILILVMDYT
jgi:hypothetical protein